MKVTIKDFMLMIANKAEEAAQNDRNEEVVRLLKLAQDSIGDVIKEFEAKIPKRELPYDMNPGGYDGDAD